MRSTDLLNKSNLSNSINFNELPLEKITDYIKMLEEFQLKSEKEGKFVEAELARQRILQLAKIRDKKRYEEVKIQHKTQKQELEEYQKQELQKFNEAMDKEFYELSSSFQAMQTQLEAKQEEKLREFIEEYQKKYEGQIAKPTGELINLNKQLELYVKKKDYPNAHNAQVEIAALTKKEQEAFELEKERHLEKEVSNFKLKQANETKALEQRIQNNYNKFKRDRALKVEELLLKYKNKFRDLENSQKSEKEAHERIIKGATSAKHK